MVAYYSVYTEPRIFFNTHTQNIYFQTWRAQDLLLDTIKVIANRVADLTIFNIVNDTGKVADFPEMSKTFVLCFAFSINLSRIILYFYLVLYNGCNIFSFKVVS